MPPPSTGIYHVQDDPASLGDKSQQHVRTVDNGNDMSVCALVQAQPQTALPESFATHSSAPAPSSHTTEPFAMPSTGPGANKISARLFGSQGAQLGLDLDLDVPLSLDVSFDTATAPGNKDNDTPATASPPYSSISSSTSFSSMSAGTSYSSLSTSTSYSSLGTALTTTAGVGAPPGTAGTTATSCRSESGDADSDSYLYTPGSPSPFLYTHAMLDRGHHYQQHQMNMGEEFKFVEGAVRMGMCGDGEERRVVSPVHAS